MRFHSPVHRLCFLLLILAIILPLMGSGTPAVIPARFAAAAPSHPDIEAAYGRLPIHFEPNQGQFAPEVGFAARGGDYTVLLGADGATFMLHQPAAAPAGVSLQPPPAMQTATLRMAFAGGNPAALAGVHKLPGVTHYFKGDSSENWLSDVPNYEQVIMSGIYAGVDVVFHGSNGALQYDFHIAPAADPRLIRLQLEGSESLALDENGDLLVTLTGGVLRQKAPVAFQEVQGQRVPVTSRFIITDTHEVGLALGDYDRRRPLVIDPTLLYSTFWGDGRRDTSNDIEVDSSGAAYIAGYTYNPAVSNSHDAFVIKINPSGSALLYTTFLIGSQDEAAYRLTRDATNAVYVTGFTTSPNFPTLNPYEDSHQGGDDAFVAKLTPTGTLSYSTYLGGSDKDVGTDIFVDGDGVAYLTGQTFSANFPKVNPYQATFFPLVGLAFISKLAATGDSLLYSTYLSGTLGAYGWSIAVDATGIYIAGGTASPNFPTAGPFQATNRGVMDVFLTKFNLAGSALIYSTYLGGNQEDVFPYLYLHDDGKVTLVGTTNSTNFWMVNPFQGSNAGGSDLFISQFNPAGGALNFSTYLGGSGNDVNYGMTIDSFGSIYIPGETFSNDFPLKNPIQETFGGVSDAFLTKMSSRANALLYSTYLGGTATDYLSNIAIDPAGFVYATGGAESSGFPTTGGAYDRSFGGNRDTIMLKIGDDLSTVEAESARVTRLGSWLYLGDSAAGGAAFMQSAESSALMILPFNDTLVKIFYRAGPDYGSFAIEVDGVLLRTVDANAPPYNTNK